MIHEAVAREIPLIYCLNRRKLAKSLGMSMRQSVVGIYKADGAYDSFKRIVAYVDRNNSGLGAALGQPREPTNGEK